MKTKNLLFLIAVTLVIAGVQKSSGTTVPAGTILTIQTMRAVSSEDAPGRPVPARLQRPVAVNGKVVIPAGTHLSGKVITSRRLTRTNDRLTVDVISVHIDGREVPMTTTGAQFLSNDIHTRGGVGISRANYTVASHKLMQFKLARPLVF